MSRNELAASVSVHSVFWIGSATVFPRFVLCTSASRVSRVS
jgi:hypothetical protein